MHDDKARPQGRKVLNSSVIQITSQRAPSVCFTVTHLSATGGLTMCSCNMGVGFKIHKKTMYIFHIYL